jgi:hypothetical protein
VPEGTDVTTPFESWALRDGKQILFATSKMHKTLQSHHFAGSYEQGAMYAYTYQEMCAIISAHLGPSDRERYEFAAKGPVDRTLIQANSDTNPDRIDGRFRAAYVLWKTLVLILKVSIKALNTVIFLVLLPLIIKWFNGFNK